QSRRRALHCLPAQAGSAHGDEISRGRATARRQPEIAGDLRAQAALQVPRGTTRASTDRPGCKATEKPVCAPAGHCLAAAAHSDAAEIDLTRGFDWPRLSFGARAPPR